MNDYPTVPAGPELDRLIAELVMGWPVLSNGAWAGFKRGNVGYARPTIHATNWRPSTDAGHAWMVMEKMKSRCDGSIKIELEATDRWSVYFSSVRGTAATMPLAVCRASLEWLQTQTKTTNK